MSDLLESLQARAVDGRIGCADAHQVAAELGLSPQQVGAFVNRETALRFDRCELGLFGYGKKGTPGYRIVQAAEFCQAEIVAAIAEHTAEESITCAALWQIAARFRYPRLGVANIAEAQGLKIRRCQLGCF